MPDVWLPAGSWPLGLTPKILRNTGYYLLPTTSTESLRGIPHSGKGCEDDEVSVAFTSLANDAAIHLLFFGVLSKKVHSSLL